MRALVLAFLLAGCLTSTNARLDPGQRVAGCWLGRTPDGVATMRWSADASVAGQLNGERTLSSSNAAPVRYTLGPRDQGWQFCQIGEGGQCWAVAQGQSGTLEGGRAFIDRYRLRLRIGIVDPEGRERQVFDGMNQRCT